MDADVLTTRVVDGIAVITLGTERRIYIDQETSDALFEALSTCAGDPDIPVVIVTGAAPGSFVRHYSIPELIRFAESVRATGREWPEARFIDGPISVVREHAQTSHRRHFWHVPRRCIRIDALLRSSHRRGWGLPDRLSRAQLWTGPGRRGHATIGAHDRDASRAHAHPDGRARLATGGRAERVRPRDRQGQRPRSRDGDCQTPVFIHAGITRVHQASGPQRH